MTTLAGCKKADPTPELKDALYQNFKSEAQAAEADVKAAETAVLDAEGEIKKAVPQTGQIKYAQKRYWEARNKLTLAEQKKRTAEVQAEMRLWKVRVACLEAFHAEKECGDPAALAEYQANAALAAKSKNWSVKDRRAALGLTTGKVLEGDPTAAAAKQAAGAEAPAGH